MAEVGIELALRIAEQALPGQGLGERPAVAEVEVQPHAPLQALAPDQVAGLGEPGHVGHEGRRTHHSLAQGGQDHAVFLGVYAEVVGIDDHLAGHGSPPLPERFAATARRQALNLRQVR
ncbi:hypothetical protein D3C85_1519630 [compost metagenome]